MKLSKEFVLRNFADKYIAVTVNDSADEQNAFITLNKSGAFVWELLQNEISYDDILSEIIKKYDIDANTAKSDLDEFLAAARKAGMLHE